MGPFTSARFRNTLTAGVMALAFGASLAQAAEQTKPRAYFETRFFRSPILHVDGEEYEIEWFDPGYTSAADAFDSNPAAAKHFKTYLDDMQTSQYLAWGSVATALTFLVMDHHQWHLPEKERSLIYNGILLTGLTVSFYHLMSGSFHLPKALNIYNGFETTQKNRSTGVNLSVTPVFLSTPQERGQRIAGGLSLQMAF